MELFTSVWIVLFLYCTEWLGIQQCWALPVPTLTSSFRHGYYSKNSWDYTRNPGAQYEKFVFPSKQQEIMPIAERSNLGERNYGKIFFPDEIPEQTKDKQYEYTDADLLPAWKTQLRPSTAITNIEENRPNLEHTKSTQSSEDGSIRIEPPKSQMQLPATSDNDANLKNSLHLHSPSRSTKNKAQEDRVQEAVQEFYKWLILSRGRPKIQPKGPKKCQEQQYETGSSSMTSTNTTSNNSVSSSKPDPAISDQSLVAGLKDQKCPEGQIRLQNGECKVKLAI